MLFSLVLIVVGAAGLLLFQDPLRQPQDIRQQASVADGPVILSQDPASGTIVPPDQELVVTISLDSAQIDLMYLKLVFNLVTTTLDEPPLIEVVNGERFALIETEIEEVDDGYLISTTAGPKSGGYFTNLEPEAVLRLTLTPVREGTIEFSFDPELSESLVANYGLAVDVLRHISAAIYRVKTSDLDGDTNDKDPDENGQLEDDEKEDKDEKKNEEQKNDEVKDENKKLSENTSDNKEIDASKSAGQEKNQVQSLGGATYATCNQSCKSNHDCAANLRCYHNQCRLATNVTSTSCTPRDKSTLASCNQSCSNNRDCQEGLACHFSRCRNPLNLESTTCQAPTSQVVEAMSQACNQSCSTHRDCPPNHLCYASSQSCRLALNPQSTSCQPASQPTVSSQYKDKGSPNGMEDKSLVEDQAATPEATTTPPPTTDQLDRELGLDDDQVFAGWLKSKTSPWLNSLSRALGLSPTGMGLILISLGSLSWLLVAIGLLASTIKNRRLLATPPAEKPAPPTKTAEPPAQPAPQKAPLTQIRPVAPAQPVAPPTGPVAPPAPPTTPPAQPATPPTQPAGSSAEPTTQPEKPPAPPTGLAAPPAQTTVFQNQPSQTQGNSNRSSMLERIKNKGVEPPGSKT